MYKIVFYSLIFLSLFSSQENKTQGQEEYIGKKVKSIISKYSTDKDFIECRIITSKPKHVVGIDLILKNDTTIKVIFKKHWLNFELLNCSSSIIVKQKIVEIFVLDADDTIIGHYYKREKYNSLGEE